MSNIDVIPTTDLAEQIADHLREQIVTRMLAPGDRVVEAPIAEAAGTSRGPVRDALALLEKEGLVERIPRRGTFVVELTSKDVFEVYTLRSAVERLAIELIVRHGDIGDLDNMTDVLREAERSIDGGNATHRGLTALDMQFHRGLLVASGHSRALETWENLATQSTLLSLLTRKRTEVDEALTTAQHRSVLEALSEGDAVLASRLINDHLEGARRSILGTFCPSPI
jgi:DNA-binding GntR family transcriptional regulator